MKRGAEMKVIYHTLGCKVNQYDTEAMRSILEKAGFETVFDEESADIAVINTCTVTNIADRKSRQFIHKNKEKLLCVCGCLAQRDSAGILSIDGVDAVIGTKNRAQIAAIIKRLIDGEQKIDAVGDIMSARDFEYLELDKSDEKVRANIKICEGCNNFCSYCIIPYARGPVRSRDIDDIKAEVGRLADTGIKEFVLTGIHIGSYGKDKGGGEKLVDVIEAVAAKRGVERVRLGSIEPSTVTEDFTERCSKIDNLCPHFHLSLQSGSDAVLARMNRKYDAEEYSAAVKRLREAFVNPAITTDIIAGFPGETDREHAETMAFVEEMRFSRIHVFPYSDRNGTRASKMSGKVPSDIKKQRARELIALGQKLENEYLKSFIGHDENVLFEKTFDETKLIGHNERYITVIGSGNVNEICSVHIEAVSDGKLIGK